METLFDKYSRWLREAQYVDNIDSIMDCVRDDEGLCCLTPRQCQRLRILAAERTLELLAEERTAALRGEV